MLQAKNIIGTMSGTSFDGIDLVYVLTNGDDFLEVKHSSYIEYSKEIKDRLHQINKSSPIIDVLLLEKDITALYGVAINNFISDNNLKKPEYIALHGQTVFHDPKNGRTLQLGCPMHLSKLCQTNIISDLRTNDMVYGGQGAPIAPIYHLFIAKKYPKPLAIINIGGIANITWISEKEELYAMDSGPGIGLLDKWIHKHNSLLFYDEDGKIARRGKINQEALDALLDNPYFDKSSTKSLDKNTFKVDEKISNLNFEDGARTLTEFTSLAIKKAFDIHTISQKEMTKKESCEYKKANILFLCGGGRKNLFLKERIQKLLELEVLDVDETGYNGDTIEAEAMAYIAIRSIYGLNFTFPNTTGVETPQGLTRTTQYIKR